MKRLPLALALLVAVSVSPAVAAQVPAPAAAPAAGPAAAAEPTDGPYAEEIAAFVREDAAAPAPRCRTLFVGGSSIAFWAELAQDFRFPVVRRGFGGATIGDVNHWFERVIVQPRPARIVYYAGENDIDDGRTPDEVLAGFKAFLERKDAALGATPVWFVSIKPSPARWHEFAQQTAANRLIAGLVSQRSDLAYVEVAAQMLSAGQPRAGLFGEDQLHMNRTGYALWTEAIGKALAARPLSTLPGCEDMKEG